MKWQTCSDLLLDSFLDVSAVTIDVAIGDFNRNYVDRSVCLPHDEPSLKDDFERVVVHSVTNCLPLIVVIFGHNIASSEAAQILI